MDQGSSQSVQRRAGINWLGETFAGPTVGSEWLERSAAHSPVRLIGVCCCCICSRMSSHSPSQVAVHAAHRLILMVLMVVVLMLGATDRV